MTNLLIELMNIDDSLDFLKDFPFSISPDVNVLFPFSSCTGAYGAWCATGTLPKKFFLTPDVGRKQTLSNSTLKLAFMTWKQNLNSKSINYHKLS